MAVVTGAAAVMGRVALDTKMIWAKNEGAQEQVPRPFGLELILACLFY
jgi:hypothetical protein